MGFYNVVAPCVVGKLHYARPTTAPIEVDDEVAAPLVESGALTVYGVFSQKALEGSVLGDAIAIAESTGPAYVAPQVGVEYVEPVEVETPAARPRASRRKATEA